MIPQDTSKLLIEQNCAVSTQSTPMTRKNSGPSRVKSKIRISVRVLMMRNGLLCGTGQQGPRY